MCNLAHALAYLGAHGLELLDVGAVLLLLSHVDAGAKPAAEQQLGVVLLVVERIEILARHGV